MMSNPATNSATSYAIALAEMQEPSKERQHKPAPLTAEYSQAI